MLIYKICVFCAQINVFLDDKDFRKIGNMLKSLSI